MRLLSAKTRFEMTAMKRQIRMMAIFSMWVAQASADSTSYTPPGGFFLLGVQGASDNPVALPLVRQVDSFGKVTGVSKNQVVIGSRIWTAGQFRAAGGTQPEAKYFVEFASGALRGVRYRVLDNTEDTLVLDTRGDDLTAHARGGIAFNDTVRLRPLWTLGDVFGKSESALVLNAKPNVLIPGDSVILPNNTDVGQNKAPQLEFSFIHGTGWRATGDLGTDQQNRPFEPASPLIVRRLSADGTSLALIGYVPCGPQVVVVSGGDGNQGNDTHICLVFPEPVSLGAAGLHDTGNETGSVIRSVPSPLIPGDQLFSYGVGTGFNLAPERRFYFLKYLGWRAMGSNSTTVGSDFILQPGRAYIVRNPLNRTDATWVQPDVR
jgi:uncharacterized protein (TIGR02597 family)